VGDYDLNKSFLNKKNIILIIVVLFLLIIAFILFFLFKAQKNNNEVFTTFSSKSNDFSLLLPLSYKFTVVEKDPYELVLRSDISGSSIYFSKTSANTIRNKNSFIEYDKNDYISKFSNISDVSDITEKTIQGFQTFNYSFKYKDTMFVDVYWILKDSTFYIIDFKINTSANDLTPHIEEILNSLHFN